MKKFIISINEYDQVAEKKLGGISTTVMADSYEGLLKEALFQIFDRFNHLKDKEDYFKKMGWDK